MRVNHKETGARIRRPCWRDGLAQGRLRLYEDGQQARCRFGAARSHRKSPASKLTALVQAAA